MVVIRDPGLALDGKLGAVISAFEPGMVNVKVQGVGTRTYHDSQLELRVPADPELGQEHDRRLPRLPRLPVTPVVEQQRALKEELAKLLKERRQPGKLVGLTGLKQAGKDSFASRLVVRHGYTRLAFADNVRQVALAVDPYIGVADLRLSKLVQYGGWERAKELPEVRRLLQRIGTEGIRNLDPGFWIRPVLTQAAELDRVVITDVRFRNEADAIKAVGGTVVRIVRPTISSADQHASETDMDGYGVDETVVNDRDLADLFNKASELAAKWELSET